MAGRAARTTYPTTYTQAAAPPFSPTNPNAWVAVVGPRFELSYDGSNRMSGETKADWNGAAYGSPATLVSGVADNINSQMTPMTVAGGNPYNGGYTETRQYNSLYQLTRLTSAGMDEQYTYSATQNDGRIASKIASGEEVVYQYDALQRLVSAVTVGPQWGMSWVYDGFGNRTAQNVVKGSVPVQSVSVDMATNRVSNWSYDANGNATSIPGVGGITYDASNRVKTVGGETYEYGPSNKRIWKNDTYTFWGGRGERVGTYTVVLMSYLPEGQQTQQYQLSFVKGTEDWYFGGRRLQVLDRLGSANGTFYPYGEERSATANPADKFATYHRDGTGLDYADQRYYHAGGGRFVTSDPYGGSAMGVRPSSWNRFTYVEGDPVNAGDPDGRQTVYYQGIPYCQHGGEGGPWWPCGPGVVPDTPQPEAPNCEANPSAPGCPGGQFVGPARPRELLPKLLGGDLTTVERALQAARRLAETEKCDKSLKDKGIESLTSLLSAIRPNAQVWDGRYSSAPGPGGQQVADFLARGTAGAVAGIGSIGEPANIFLGAVFFDPTSANVSAGYLPQAQAFMVLHEAVHAAGGKTDADFGGSGNLTKLLIDNCFPVLSGRLGNLYR